MFKHSLLITFLVLADATCVFSQRPIQVDFGARAGVPFSITIESKLTGVAGVMSSQGYDRPPVSVGPTVNTLFRDRLAVEFDALYTRIRGRGGAFSTSLPTSSSTHGSSWEFPIVADYYLVRSPIRLYLGGGLMAGAVTSGTTEIRTTSTETGVTTVRQEAFHTSPSQLPAYIVNGGMEWRSSRIVIRPELRYTRWSAVSQNTNAARHNNQFEYLIGFSFRGYKHD